MRVGYRAKRIIDGKKSVPILKNLLVIDGHKIEAIAPEAHVGKDLKIVDIGDSTLLPGLIDSHVHLADDGSSLPRALVENESHGLTLLRSAQRAWISLTSGVTTLRDMGAPSGIVPDLKEALDRGILRGPRLVTCNTQIMITGAFGRKVSILGIEVDGVDDVRKAVREMFKCGADFIKMMASGKTFVEGVSLGAAQFSQEEITVAVEEAHRSGKTVSVHAVGLKAVESSIKAGVDCIEHGIFLTRELAKQMVDRGIRLVPTLLPYYRRSHPSSGQNQTGEITRKAETVWKGIVETVHAAREAGVQIGAGTDSGGPFLPHNSLIEELQLLVSLGFSPLEAIISATRINAETVGLQEIGVLENGKMADVIAVAGDPSEDIKALSQVIMVLKGGEEIMRDSRFFG